MASEDETAADPAPDPVVEPVPCSACRGTGQVVSNLGGQRRLVDCPWCDGGGVRLTDHDAQARRRGEAAGAGASEQAGPVPESTGADPGPDDDQVA